MFDGVTDATNIIEITSEEIEELQVDIADEHTEDEENVLIKV